MASLAATGAASVGAAAGAPAQLHGETPGKNTKIHPPEDVMMARLRAKSESMTKVKAEEGMLETELTTSQGLLAAVEEGDLSKLYDSLKERTNVALAFFGLEFGPPSQVDGEKQPFGSPEPMAFVDGPGEPTEKATQMTETLQRAMKATTLLPVESREAMKSRAEMLLDIEGFETLSSATAIEELSEAISQQVEQLKQLKLSVKNLSVELTKERRKQDKTANDAQT